MEKVSGKCHKCGFTTNAEVLLKMDFPKTLPEGFYQMFPEERGKTHPKSFQICPRCFEELEVE